MYEDVQQSEQLGKIVQVQQHGKRTESSTWINVFEAMPVTAAAAKLMSSTLCFCACSRKLCDAYHARGGPFGGATFACDQLVNIIGPLCPDWAANP
jgi:hypothetical protein